MVSSRHIVFHVASSNVSIQAVYTVTNFAGLSHHMRCTAEMQNTAAQIKGNKFQTVSKVTI